MVKRGDLSRELYEAGLRQDWILSARACIVITAVYTRTTRRYGERGVRYVHIEVGHTAQNIYLQATALGLATVAIGAFHDERVREIIGAPPEEHVLYMMPLAKPGKPYNLNLEDLARYIVERRRTRRT
jgi:SagB-type dehydrogenase family enzyme